MVKSYMHRRRRVSGRAQTHHRGEHSTHRIQTASTAVTCVLESKKEMTSWSDADCLSVRPFSSRLRLRAASVSLSLATRNSFTLSVPCQATPRGHNNNKVRVSQDVCQATNCPTTEWVPCEAAKPRRDDASIDIFMTDVKPGTTTNKNNNNTLRGENRSIETDTAFGIFHQLGNRVDPKNNFAHPTFGTTSRSISYRRRSRPVLRFGTDRNWTPACLSLPHDHLTAMQGSHICSTASSALKREAAALKRGDGGAVVWSHSTTQSTTSSIHRIAGHTQTNQSTSRIKSESR